MACGQCSCFRGWCRTPRRNNVHSANFPAGLADDDHQRHLLGFLGQYLQRREELPLRTFLLGLRHRHFPDLSYPRTYHGQHRSRRLQHDEQHSCRGYFERDLCPDWWSHLQPGEPVARGRHRHGRPGGSLSHLHRHRACRRYSSQLHSPTQRKPGATRARRNLRAGRRHPRRQSLWQPRPGGEVHLPKKRHRLRHLRNSHGPVGAIPHARHDQRQSAGTLQRRRLPNTRRAVLLLHMEFVFHEASAGG